MVLASSSAFGIRVFAADLFEMPLGEADEVTMYLLPEVNLRLRPEDHSVQAAQSPIQ